MGMATRRGMGVAGRGQEIASNVSKSERHLAMLLFIWGSLHFFVRALYPFFSASVAPSNKH